MHLIWSNGWRQLEPRVLSNICQHIPGQGGNEGGNGLGKGKGKGKGGKQKKGGGGDVIEGMSLSSLPLFSFHVDKITAAVASQT